MEDLGDVVGLEVCTDGVGIKIVGFDSRRKEQRIKAKVISVDSFNAANLARARQPFALGMELELEQTHKHGQRWIVVQPAGAPNWVLVLPQEGGLRPSFNSKVKTKAPIISCVESPLKAQRSRGW